MRRAYGWVVVGALAYGSVFGPWTAMAVAVQVEEDNAGSPGEPVAHDESQLKLLLSDPTPVPHEQSEPSIRVADARALPRDANEPSEPVPLPPRLAHLEERLEQCLAFYFDRPLNTREDSPWSVMHSFLGFGVSTPLAVGGSDGQRVNAIGWLCWNRPTGGLTLFQLDGNRIVGREGPGLQGHAGQFLAMLAQCKVSPDYGMRIDGRDFTVSDLIESEKLTCRDKTELTFKLIALSHYLDSDAEWRNNQGQLWSIPRLIRNEIVQPVNGAACGGTHRLMGLSYCVYKRRQAGKPIDGWWAKSDKYIRDYHRYTWTLQHRDGSFSSDWFRRRTDWGGIDRKLQTTGHILEWLVFSLPDEELLQERTLRTVEYLTNLMLDNRYRRWEVGPRGHACRALRLYHERVFEGLLTNPQQRVALLGGQSAN